MDQHSHYQDSKVLYFSLIFCSTSLMCAKTELIEAYSGKILSKSATMRK
jgi:hypothetical protein